VKATQIVVKEIFWQQKIVRQAFLFDLPSIFLGRLWREEAPDFEPAIHDFSG
jgi:hypothetical protein